MADVPVIRAAEPAPEGGARPETPPDRAPQAQPDQRRPRWGTRWVHSLTLPGLWGALVFSCLSFTPSLLPRSGVTQGLVWGITGAIGYGLGVLAAAIWRAFPDRPPRTPRTWAWRTFAIAGAVLLVASFALGQYWQVQVRDRMGVSDYSIPLVIASPLVAALVFWLLLMVSRGLRRAYHAVARLLARWMGRRAANAVGWILVAGVVYLLVTGLLLDGLVNAANSAFSVKNGTTPAGVHQPTSSLRSGGPGSLIPWSTLGLQGRKFTGLGPTSHQIEAVTGKPAVEPVRTYAGLESAGSAEARARLAVQDLERAGGFQRKNLLVVTTTGSGWVDPAMVDSFEYLTGGDAATVSIQYSYLPSWISFLVDQSNARDAGRALFDAIYGSWLKLPPKHRPRVFVAGESLGSFGGETAFSGEYSMSNLTSGVLFTGPPNFNTLFRQFVDNRQPGSPEVQPVYQHGRIVRFANDPQRPVVPTNRPWSGTRVLYLLHPSDPIVWWTPRLVFGEPDWIGEQPGSDVLVLHGMVWMPFVTFWQVTADLPFATGVPAGHGHNYVGEYVDGWNAVLRPAGATPQELTEVRKVVSALPR